MPQKRIRAGRSDYEKHHLERNEKEVRLTCYAVQTVSACVCVCDLSYALAVLPPELRVLAAAGQDSLAMLLSILPLSCIFVAVGPNQGGTNIMTVNKPLLTK